MTESPWFPYLYQYCIGGTVFFSAIFIALRKRALQLSFKRDRNLLLQLVAGFILYAALHALLIILAGVEHA